MAWVSASPHDDHEDYSNGDSPPTPCFDETEVSTADPDA